MIPEQYHQLKAFRDLITDTIDSLRYAGSQGALSAAADTAAEKWSAVDDNFARVLRDIQSKAWSMPYQQVKPVVEAVIAHLEEQLPDIDRQMDA